MAQPIPFGKYYLLERINVGGMAEVFKAKAVGVEGFERTVAVKRILPSIAEDQEFITMFIDEAKIAVQLTHANIAQIFDLGRVDDSYFIALEYVQGRDLRAIFNRARNRGEALAPKLACYVIMKVCEGLDYAHNKRDAGGQFLNLVHRDVSPQNVLVSYEGEVKVIDFGIAKAAGKASNTQAGILKGKFGYMSPEQAHGLDIDRRSDIFAVGICLYELLTGQRAFLGESDIATLENVRAGNLTPPRVHRPELPEALEQIVLKALSADRDQRYATALELHQALAAFVRSEPGLVADRRDLSAYMHREFAEEIAADRADNADEPAEDLDDEFDEVSGLAAFDHLSPQEIEVGLNEPLPMVGRASHKVTLPGLPVLADTAGSSPRFPAPGSISDSIPVSPRSALSVPAPALEWDEEELSTQIYDPPEERTSARAELHTPPPPLELPQPGPSARSLSGRPAPHNDVSPSSTPSWVGNRRQRFTLTQVSTRGLQRSFSQRLAIAGAVVVLGIVGAVLATRAAAPGAIELETTPSNASLSLDGQPVPGESPFRVEGVSSGRSHSLTIERPGYRSWSAMVELRPGERVKLQPLVLEPVESGFALDSVPSGASVFVNGVRLEQTTPVRVSALGAGEHRIRVEAQGYAPWESSVKVAAGTVLDLPVAQLIATSPPATESPAAPPERHQVERHIHPGGSLRGGSALNAEAREPAYRRSAASVQPQRAPQVPAQAAAKTGSGQASSADRSTALRIQTKPWSSVWIDGQPVGPTPLMNVAVKPGPHSLLFVNEEFGIRKSVEIDVPPGKISTHLFDLTR